MELCGSMAHSPAVRPYEVIVWMKSAPQSVLLDSKPLALLSDAHAHKSEAGDSDTLTPSASRLVLWQISFTWNLTEALWKQLSQQNSGECFPFPASDLLCADELKQAECTSPRSSSCLVRDYVLLLLWLAAWAGMALAYRRHELPASVREDYGTIVGATLTLLGLLIGFTFSMATTRYDLRKHLEVEEANSIGTEYARLDFLPAADAGQLHGLLRQYTGLRIRFYTTRNQAELRQLNTDTARMQNQMWAFVSQAAQLQPSPLSPPFASSGMNDDFEFPGLLPNPAFWKSHSNRGLGLDVFDCHPREPALAKAMGMHRRALSALRSSCRLRSSISFFLIADIDSPRGGVIRIHPQNLVCAGG